MVKKYFDKFNYPGKKFAAVIFVFITVFPLGAQSANFYLERGRASLGRGEISQAIEDFDRAVALNPTDASIWEARGSAYKENGEVGFAIRDYTMAIALNPNFNTALYNRGIVYYESGDFNAAVEDFSRITAFEPNLAYSINYRGFAYYAKGERELAAGDFSAALELNPNLITEWIENGDGFYNEGYNAMAIDRYTKALIMNPDHDLALFKRGLACYYKGDLDPAIDDLTRATTVNPQFADAYLVRGIAYSDKGWPDLAIKDFSKVIALDQNYFWAWNNRGYAYQQRGDLDWAIDDYTRAIEIDDSIVTVWNNRGGIYSGRGDFDLAIEDYTRAINLDPDNYLNWCNRGNSYYNKGEYEKAIEDYSKAIDLYPGDSSVWHWRGMAYTNRYSPDWDSLVEDFNKAGADYTEALSLNPDNTWTWYWRGVIYDYFGETDLAIADFDKAIETDPDNDWAWYMRGVIFYNTGEFDQAVEYVSRAISINPNDSDHFRVRGASFKAKGEDDPALEDFNKAVALDRNIINLEYRGIFYRDTLKFDLAIEDFNSIIEINPDYYFVWLGRGKTYKDKGDPDRAIEDFDRAIEIEPEGAFAWIWKGEAYYDKGQYALAVECISNGIAYTENSLAWYSRALAHYANGNMIEALEDYRQAIELAEKSSNVYDLFSRAWDFAGSLYHRFPFLNDSIYGDDEFYLQYANLTRDALERSIARAEQVRSTMGSRGTEMMQGLLYQYYAGVDFEVRFGSAESAFNFSERLRSRGFLEQMGIEEALKLPGINPADAQRVRELTREIGSLQGLLPGLNPQTDTERIAETGAALNRAETELAALDARIAERVPRYTEFRNPSPINISRARSFCGDDLAVLEYVLWDSSINFRAPVDSRYSDRPSINSYCLIITSDGVTSVRLDPDFDYAGMVESLRSGLLTRRYGRIQPESTFETENNALYRALIMPVLEHIPGNIRNILIVPDGNLAILPFDILRENSESPYLAERYSITLSPSLSVSVVARQKEIASTEPIIAFGGAWYEREESGNAPPPLYVENLVASLSDQLPALRGSAGEALPEKVRAVDYFNMYAKWDYLKGSVAEVVGLREIVTQEPRIIMGRDVSKRNIKRLSLEGTLLDYPIIHFATHGYFNDNLIPQAALVLSEYSGLINESREDGYLSIEDIALLQLNARMVMLSACETGLGQIKRGDGMSGLSRAFMTAGAQNVGVSLWQISDAATVEFMWNVYRKVIHEGKSFRDAYSEVKEEFRNSRSWYHPYYWACFTLYE